MLTELDRMKKTKLYILTFAAISLVTILAGLGALRYYYSNARETLWAHKTQSGQREIRELGILLEQQLRAGIPSADAIEHLQQSILNTDVQSEFVCMYNTDGIELCHPDPALVGTKIVAGNSRFTDSASSKNFDEILRNGKQASGIRTFPGSVSRSSEIVSVFPVKGTNWMLASHANLAVLQLQMDYLYQKFMFGTLLLVVVISGSCFWLIRLIYRKYERDMNLQIAGLNEEINELSMFNRSLELKQQNAVADTNKTIPSGETTRRRIITYQKDEINTIDVGDISYIFLADNIVSVQTFQKQMYTINNSLDDLMKQLDNDTFYRANRQYIVNINAIETILVYGQNQLQLNTRPKSPEPVIISKNKVSEFKKWLDR
ncbi:LytTR family transcriptional regulator [Niastella populi]|nr:LytTR family transcriptional regulator [Niastella populi]